MEDIIAKHWSGLVENVDRINSSQQVLRKLKEFAMGGYIDTPADSKVLGFGFHILDVGIGTEVKIGPGVARKGFYLNQPSFTANGIQSLTLLEGLNTYNSSELVKYYPEGESVVRDAYVSGSIYLVITDPAENSNALTTSFAVTYSSPLLVGRNESFTEIKTKLANNLTPSGAVPSVSPNQTAVELYKFVISLDTYEVGISSEKIVAETAIFDVRRNQCFGGFAEEKMATTLMPPIIELNELVDASTEELSYQLFRSIESWANSYSDFESHWSDSPYMLQPLRDYILSKFGTSM